MKKVSKSVNLAIKPFFEAHHDGYRTTIVADQGLSRCLRVTAVPHSKDLAVALSIEASELLELFLLKGNVDTTVRFVPAITVRMMPLSISSMRMQ